MNKRKISKTEITKIIDQNGEIIIDNVKSQSFLIDREPDYVKLYIDDIARLKDIPSGMSKILFEIIKGINYNGIVMAYKPIKQIMCNNMGISMNYLNKCIDTFHKQGILIRYARGVYIADPNLFAKGSWNNIKNLRLIIEYHNDGTKKLKSNVSEEMKNQLKLNL